MTKWAATTKAATDSLQISCWYPRKEMAVRNTFFYVISIVISGLSATLAYGLGTLHNKGGLQGVSLAIPSVCHKC